MHETRFFDFFSSCLYVDAHHWPNEPCDCHPHFIRCRKTGFMDIGYFGRCHLSCVDLPSVFGNCQNSAAASFSFAEKSIPSCSFLYIGRHCLCLFIHDVCNYDERYRYLDTRRFFSQDAHFFHCPFASWHLLVQCILGHTLYRKHSGPFPAACHLSRFLRHVFQLRA